MQNLYTKYYKTALKVIEDLKNWDIHFTDDSIWLKCQLPPINDLCNPSQFNSFSCRNWQAKISKWNSYDIA